MMKVLGLGGSSRRSRVLVLLGVVLLGISWVLAQWPPTHRAKSAAEIESVSTGLNILISGLLPWLVQWLGLGTLSFAVAGNFPTVKRRFVAFAIIMPLLVGLGWWIGLEVMFWRSDPLEAATKLVSLSIREQLDGESIFESMLFHTLGPLVCPLLLHGPFSLRGWTFMWTGLSTALVMAYWTWGAHWLELESIWSVRVTRKQLRRSIALILLYMVPVLLRAILRVAAVLSSP